MFDNELFVLVPTTSANGAGTNRMTIGGHHCRVIVRSHGCWVSQWALCSLASTVELDWHLPQNWQNWQIRLVLFTDEIRFYLSTCDRRDRLWRRCGECYAACNIIQHDWFGGESVMVWGGIPLEGRTDLYRLDNSTLTAIRHQDEMLGPVVRPYAGAMGPGFFLVHNNAQPHVARLCRQFLENEGIDTIDWPTGSPDLNPIEHLWDIMFRSIQRHQVALQTVQELSDALVQIWEEIPQDTIRRLIRSMSGPYKLLSTASAEQREARVVM
ncbi:hypothetical protein NFI96_029872, partial [Prochilodus magdalenae]